MNKVIRANLYKTCSGIVMVELAIILPLLLFLLFGITELGRALHQQNQLTQAVELGGRYMARVEGVDDSCVANANWEAASTIAKNIIRCGNGTTACAAPVVPKLETDNILVEACGPGAANDKPCTLPPPPACVIAVSATAPFQSIFGADDLVSVPGFSLGGVTLNASTQERYIGL